MRISDWSSDVCFSDLVMGVPAGALKGPMRLRPAKLADLQGLLEGTHQKKFEIGDIVTLRPWAHGRYKWPQEGDRCIVTQVLDAPRRAGEDGSAMESRPKDIALAFLDPDGDVMEYLHDSRMFQKVGSIYDPVTLPDGEQLPVQ